jgi:hypothetical protein
MSHDTHDPSNYLLSLPVTSNKRCFALFLESQPRILNFAYTCEVRSQPLAQRIGSAMDN